MKTYWFIFCDTKLMVECKDGVYDIPCTEQCPIDISSSTEIKNISPMNDGTPVKTIVIEEPVEGYEFHPLRSTYNILSFELYNKAGKCHEINYWDANNRFCGTCGAPMRFNTDISKICTKCGKEIWPLLATAVIVLIRRGDNVLLVRARTFRHNFYGLVAGFVETGETLEEAVIREVKEETGLSITNLQYFASQPWPYPCGLMVGFNADYADGEITLQEEELCDARWFSYDNMPAIPEKLSIARRLIDNWLKDYNSIAE